MRPDSAPAGIRAQIDELHPSLLRFARSLTSSAADAEDLAQETLTRALRFEGRFEPGTDARAWLFTICRRLQQRRWRTDRSRPSHVALADLGNDPEREDDLLVSPLSVEPVVMRRFEKEALLQALRRLSPDHAVPLRLYAGEGMPYRDIAEVLDLPLGTVMSRIYRARRMLVKLLLEEGMR